MAIELAVYATHATSTGCRCQSTTPSAYPILNATRGNTDVTLTVV